MKHVLGLVGLSLVVASCAEKKTTTTPSQDTREQASAMQQVDVTTSEEFATKHSTFDSYWFRGQAELSRYELEQSRYGEVHEGESVLVFVTEPFLTDKQVKYEGGDDTHAVQVLKLNNYRRFYTGIYPYSIMTSTFTPVADAEPTIKLSHTVQEWCGHVFAQANLLPSKDGYDVRSFSYFMNEGDRDFRLGTTLLEDELFTRVRMGPDELPVGPITLLPSATYLRLMHRDWAPVEAVASLSDPTTTADADEPVRVYEISYPSLDRVVTITFEEQFPHRIVAWTDRHRALFDREGGEAPMLETKARLTESIMLDYWNKNSLGDAPWRDVLGLRW